MRHRMDMLYDPPETAQDWRDALLIAMAESGGWVALETAADAWPALRKWLEHCRRGSWLAFEFRWEDGVIWGRFRGTRIVPARKRSGRSSTADMMRRMV